MEPARSRELCDLRIKAVAEVGLGLADARGYFTTLAFKKG
jgi:hypothetical protein